MTNEIQISNKLIGDNHECFITAEIGINHNGSLNIAKHLIDMAKETGCDAVKFQKRTINAVNFIRTKTLKMTFVYHWKNIHIRCT